MHLLEHIVVFFGVFDWATASFAYLIHQQSLQRNLTPQEGAITRRRAELPNTLNQ